ncbi:MAG: histone deacetylase family protein [Candidatus Aenigmatarchaeota archaeon]
MKIVYSKECLQFGSKGHPESPSRVEKAKKFLEKKGYEFLKPGKCSEEDLRSVHSRRLIEKVKNEEFSNPDCPNYHGIYDYARLSVGGALEAAEINGFSLMRPPGHHATRDSVGGFCYFNSIAVALEKFGHRALIVDIDRHHGNGTQDIFLGSERVEYVSLHGPGYPGTGTALKENYHNHLFRKRVGEGEYMKVLDKLLNLDREFDILAVSAGFDTYKQDPLASKIHLSTESYRSIGQRLAELELPVFCVLEGGYSAGKLGENIHSFLQGLQD